MSTVPSTSASATSSSSQYTYSNGTYFPTPFHLQQQPPPQPYIGAAPPPVQLPGPPVYPAPAPGVYTLPQFQQAQQLFQRDAQTITPEALENVKAALASSEIEHKAEAKKKAVPRKAAGQSWEDPTLAEWPENCQPGTIFHLSLLLDRLPSLFQHVKTSDDYRLFCGDLGNEVNDDVLSKAFSRFPTFNMAKVVRDKRTGKTKGYGFVSFSNPLDLAAALKEMNGDQLLPS
nr:RNA-binding protein 42-like isoform X3 [Nicotiana tomentosiformis]